MKKNTQIDISQFVEFFPVLELPITLSDDTHHDFSAQNEPLPPLGIKQFILPIEKEVDEYTEFVACLRIADTYDFHTIVYWKAGLMNYQYVMVSYDKKGEIIDSRVLAGTYADGENDRITKSVATIEEDWLINIVSGQAGSDMMNYDAASSKTFSLELLPDGKIVNDLSNK